MDINFVKLHTCGKDYILLDGFKYTLDEKTNLQNLSESITDRHHGVGAYGFILLYPGQNESVAARMFNNHGVELEPDPDGLRCLGRYAYDAGLLGDSQCNIETNTKTLQLAMIDGQTIAVKLGPPLFSHNLDEITEKPDLNIDQSTRLNNRLYAFTPLHLSCFHAVLYTPAHQFNLTTLGKRLARHPGFQSSPSVELVRVYSRDEVRIRTWHPFLGETPSSGAGSGAAVVASVIHGFADRDVLVHNRGGDLFVQWVEDPNMVMIAGSVEYSFTGTFYWEEEGSTPV